MKLGFDQSPLANVDSFLVSRAMVTSARFRKLTLGKLLKQQRIQKNLTQGDVSKLLGYSSPQFVSNWERELARPPMETMGKLLDLYGIDKREFVEFWVEEQRSIITHILYKKAK